MNGLLRADAVDVFHHAVQAADPLQCVQQALSPTDLEDLSSGLGLLAVGKASIGMVSAALELLSDRGIDLVGGVVVTTSDPDGPRMASAVAAANKLERRVGGHPLPDRSSARSADAVERWLSSDSWKNLLVLLSGGASALLCAPAAGLSLADKLTTTREMLLAGASIDQLNTVRKHLSRIKGGGMAQAVGGRRVLVLALSDVPGDQLTTIASGPLVGDPTTFEQAMEVVETLDLGKRLPRAVVARLQGGARGELDETPEPGAARFRSIEHRIVGSNATSVDAAERRARDLGYRVERLEAPLVGEAREAGRRLARCLGQKNGRSGPWAWVAGGETSVSVTGPGRGGRNQELALAFALQRKRFEPESQPRLEAGEDWVFLSAGSDGVDGPTDAAGAVVDSKTGERAVSTGLDPIRGLDDNDSYSILDASGDLLRPGPTGTNVADIQVFLSRGGRR